MWLNSTKFLSVSGPCSSSTSSLSAWRNQKQSRIFAAYQSKSNASGTLLFCSWSSPCSSSRSQCGLVSPWDMHIIMDSSVGSIAALRGPPDSRADFRLIDLQINLTSLLQVQLAVVKSLPPSAVLWVAWWALPENLTLILKLQQPVLIRNPTSRPSQVKASQSEVIPSLHQDLIAKVPQHLVADPLLRREHHQPSQLKPLPWRKESLARDQEMRSSPSLKKRKEWKNKVTAQH